MPKKYWKHFCLLVFGIRILQQRTITRKQLIEAHTALVQFCMEYENLYYQRAPERLHFVRQSIHVLIHLGPESERMGPLWAYTQWTMERYIGDIGAEIRQHSNPFANLSERNVRRAQVNALKAMFPDLDTAECSGSAPRGSVDIGEGYRLLAAHDAIPRLLQEPEAKALLHYLRHAGETIPLNLEISSWSAKVERYARLQLPNGQIARSAWKECQKKLEDVRISRMVKLRNVNAPATTPHSYGEIRFFFPFMVKGKRHSLALVSMYSDIDLQIFNDSHKTLAVCRYQGDEGLVVVDAHSVCSVISMQPLPMTAEEESAMDAPERFGNRWFVCEKPGLDVANFASGTHHDMESFDNSSMQ
ncbi:hypothetical protein BXZ70DRAFT_895310 [Cristinia sonorae]|uniref:Uncharacterized protein n=1 Tax=Cristinia sonorae TaxID=1940300 RepID=A0A8K0UM10_9AGAR|nr:hypothetical protein BXZ70DRAFT_895310 [Cristinia sonorae]